MNKLIRSMACSMFACVLFAGCSQADQPADDPKETETADKPTEKSSESAVELNAKTDGSTALQAANRSGYVIAQFEVSAMDQEEPEWEKLMDGKQKVEKNENFLWHMPEDSEELAGPWRIRITFLDGAKVVLHDLSKDKFETATHMALYLKEGMAYLTYTDAKGNPLSTYEDELLYKDSLEKELASSDEEKDIEKTEDNQEAEEPVEEQPVLDESVNSDPVYHEPAYQEPAYQEPVYQEPAYQEPAYQEPSYQEPVVDTPSYDFPSFDDPVYETPSIDSGSSDSCLGGA